MNTFLNGMKEATNYTYTTNGALTHKSTGNKLMDLFAQGGAYRLREDEDVINLFKGAFEENEEYAMKCLFYLRDAREGQGERRFFRVCMRWLAKVHPEAVRRNMEYFSEYGRVDDLYCLDGTQLEHEMYQLLRAMVNEALVELKMGKATDKAYYTFKWLKSINCSNAESRRLGNKTRQALGLTYKQYRKMLAYGRKETKVLERLMSDREFHLIEFDKIPSIAGVRYRNAFIRHDLEREKLGIQSYADFAKDETTKVNADVLYPYECVKAAEKEFSNYTSNNNINRLMINKYWDNLKDYFNNAKFNGLAVVDTSGSMTIKVGNTTPLQVAVSLGMYCAEKAKGPFKDHFITFSRNPNLVEIEGVDFVDKVKHIERADWGMNTDIKKVFDLMLNTALKYGCPQEDLPENLIIISDMQFDQCCSSNTFYMKTDMEAIETKWNTYGYKMPNLVFWNVNAGWGNKNIPMTVKDGITYVSGFSPVLFEQIMSGKTAYEMMFDKLDSDRYACIK